jgi:hypothetical protein
LISDRELSIEHFMRRNPCILDRGSAFLDRNPWLYQLVVVLCTASAVVLATIAARALKASSLHLGAAYTAVAIHVVLLCCAFFRPPGSPPPNCRDEASVIKLLHGWPSSSHHYGLHASEWARSWSFCQVCDSWRPARAHHCSRCRKCVLMLDHHCVWIGQCVGANNLRHFFAYVLSLLLLSVYGLWLSWRYVSHFPSPSSTAASGNGPSLELFVSLLVLCGAGMGMGSYLVARCVRMLLRNETAIEGLKKEQWREQQRAVKQAKQHTPNPDPEPAEGKASTKQRTSTAASSSGSKGQSDADTAAAAARADAENGLLLSPDHGNTDPSLLRFFSPFQCACHAASFRVLYCQQFNYPSLRSSSTPIPPLPFYFDYDTRVSLSLNAFLCWEDLCRNESMHRWVSQGAQPIRIVGRHMLFVPPPNPDASAATGVAGGAQQQPLPLQVLPHLETAVVA